MSSRNATVLVVDGDATAVAALQPMLTDYSVERVADAQAALHWLKEHPRPVAILLCIGDARVGGAEFIAIRSRTRYLLQIPVIPVRKAGTPASTSGLLPQLAKPFRRKDVVDAVERCLPILSSGA